MKVLIFYHYLTCIGLCFECVCVCFCVTACTGRQKDTVERLAKEYQHTRAHTHADITRIRLSCGGDECDADSLSLRIHIHTNMHTSVSVYVYICYFLVCFSENILQLVA